MMDNTIRSRICTVQVLSSWKRFNWFLIAAVTLTFVNGLFISFMIFPAVTDAVGLENYGDGWAQTAENLVQGKGFVYNPDLASTFMTGHLKREPGYSLFLALILVAFGKLDPYMMLFQVLINSLTCFVLYFIVAKTFNPQVGLFSCFFYALYPFASWYVPRIAYETLLAFVVTLLVLSLVMLFERLSFGRALLVGILLGITVLCRSIFLLFPVALLPGLIARFGIKNTGVVRYWVIILLITLVVLCPWIIRNYVVSHEFVPTTTQGGIAYFIGNKIVEYYTLPANTAGSRPEREGDQMYTQIRNATSNENPNLSHAEIEALTDKKLIQIALADVIAYPLRFVGKLVKGAALVWFVGDTGIKSTALLVMQGPLVLLCGIGISCALKANKRVSPLLTILIYFILIQTAFSSYGRYSYPIVPVLIAFAAYALEMFRLKYLNGRVGLLA
jgi:4-amino-4-deoxy-L-arabinose transferase-like glycosyltransferase